MKNQLLKLSIIVMSMFASNLFANGSCTLANVTGTIDNNIVNAKVQSGIINIQLTSEDDVLLFESTGGVVGRITSEDGADVTTLDHTIFFDGVDTLTTMDDIAQAIPPYVKDGCIYYVEETISTFWGMGIFKNASGEIYADGFINLCDPEHGFTHFALLGTVCLK